LARVVLGQLLPDDRKIEWASNLPDAERLLVGMATATASASHTEAGNETLERARAVFREMQQEYAAGNFARYGELLQQLGKLLLPQ
jgi:DNA-binding GntR family transcriptional regulator